MMASSLKDDQDQTLPRFFSLYQKKSWLVDVDFPSHMVIFFCFDHFDPSPFSYEWSVLNERS